MYSYFLAFILCYFYSASANAESAKKTEDSLMDSIGQSIEDQRAFISDEIMDASNEIDVYFSNTNYLKTRNTSNLRISNESNIIEDTGYENNFDIALRLKLPRSQDKLQLEVDQQVDEFQTSGDTYSDYTIIDRNRRQNGGTKAGLNYYERVFETDVRLTAGFDYKNQLIPWTNLKFKNDIFLTKSKRHYIQIINDFYGETRDGTEHRASITYNYQLTKKLIFRQSNQSRYRDKDNYFEVSQGISFFHIINNKNSMAYIYNAYFKNPSFIETYYLDRHIINISYRRRLFNKHYYASITPGLIIPKEKSWEVLTSLQIKLEMYFGNP